MVGTIVGVMSTEVDDLAIVRLHLCSMLSVAAKVWVAVTTPVVVGIDARGVDFRDVESPPTSTLFEARGGVFPPTTTPCWCIVGRCSPGAVLGWNGGEAASCGMEDAEQES